MSIVSSQSLVVVVGLLRSETIELKFFVFFGPLDIGRLGVKSSKGAPNSNEDKSLVWRQSKEGGDLIRRKQAKRGEKTGPRITTGVLFVWYFFPF